MAVIHDSSNFYIDKGCKVAVLYNGKECRCMECPFISCLLEMNMRKRREYTKVVLRKKYKDEIIRTNEILGING